MYKKQILVGAFTTLTIVTRMALGCGPCGDWFRKSKEESAHRVRAYHSLMGKATSWQYYRPYLAGKLLLRDKKYAEAETHYTQWAARLRRQGGGRILGGTALWAVSSANLRLLCLEVLSSSPHAIHDAMRVCDAKDAGQKDMAIAAAARVPDPLRAYLIHILTEATSSGAALRQLKPLDKNHPIYPLLLYRAVRYEEDHGKAMGRAGTFISLFPYHYLADDVMGWQARCYLKLGQREEATSRYLDVLLQHPDGDMVNACLESLRLFRKETFVFRDRNKHRLFTYIKALFRERAPLEGSSRLLGLAATCEEDPVYRAIVPEILYEAVRAGVRPLYYTVGDGTSRPYGHELAPESQSALKRLAVEFPTHRKAALMAVTYLRPGDLSQEELIGLATYCDNHLTCRRLIRRLHAQPQAPSAQTLLAEGDPVGYLKTVPLGPELFEILSGVDFLTIEYAPHRKERWSDSIIETAFKVLPELASIPMTEDEYRLYALLQLRMCTMSARLDEYPAAREVTRTLSFNDLERQELDLLDSAYALRKNGEQASLRKIVGAPGHPYRMTAGKLLARHAQKTRDWPALLWSSAYCDVYDAFGVALNNVSPLDLDQALESEIGGSAHIRAAMLLRRAGHAVITRDIGWIRKHGIEVRALCESRMKWLPEVMDKVVAAGEMLAHVKSDKERHVAQYAVATASYMRNVNNLDFHYDCYLRLKQLAKELRPGEEDDLKARVLFSMATSLQKARDGRAIHTYYGFRSFKLGDTWYSTDELAMHVSDDSVLDEIAHLYRRVADEHPRTTLADDALYWAAYAHYQSAYGRYHFIHRPTHKQKTEKQALMSRVNTLMQRILEDYPEGDFAAHAKRWQRSKQIGLRR
ncbi:MAG: hypothetical protein HN919_04565 [Verrucomicrobia bacterium]|jgi:hypothetical protein|nr:hypothetical protein [Verrucomicrobiota bacterium]